MTEARNGDGMVGPPEVRLRDLLGGGAGDALTIAVAESCSGGGVALRITGVPGSSDYFRGGIVAYGNDAKRDLLGVDEELLATRGAVSAESAGAMAAGALRAFGATVAVATTGIAGPGGATARKPVGLVYVASIGPFGTTVEEHHVAGGRAEVTNAAIDTALRMLVAAVEQSLARSAPTKPA